jgi:hypothetical protein
MPGIAAAQRAMADGNAKMRALDELASLKVIDAAGRQNLAGLAIPSLAATLRQRLTANLDPAHGGLVIWDQPAPLDRDFAKYNVDAEAGRRFL